MKYSNNNLDMFYDEILMPFRGLLEEWYVANQNIISYLSLIGLIIWVVLLPWFDINQKVYKELRTNSEDLKKYF